MLKYLFTFLVILTTAQAMAKTASEIKIVVASDTHLMAPELVISGGAAIDNYVARDMRMIALSDDIMGAWVQDVIARHPQLVLLTGDLTKDGERASHQRMAGHLSHLEQAGIKVLVIPGNHDISNPNAVLFDDASIRPAPTVTRDEFATIYADYGYRGTLRDTASLSYVVEPVDGLVVIGIDSNLDRDNRLTARGDSADVYHNGGRVAASTLQWIADRAGEAHAQGKQVMAMMHHHAVEHFDGEQSLLPRYVVENANALRSTLMASGVHNIFTGHLHVSDVARHIADGDSITEVATGSLITYPFAYREINVAPTGQVAIATHQLSASTLVPDLQALGREKIDQAAPHVIDMVANRLWKKLGQNGAKIASQLSLMGQGNASLPADEASLRKMLHQHFGDIASGALLAFCNGNENGDIVAQSQQRVNNLIAHVLPNADDNVRNFLCSALWERVEPMVRSLLEDKNQVGTPAERTVDDLTPTPFTL